MGARLILSVAPTGASVIPSFVVNTGHGADPLPHCVASHSAHRPSHRGAASSGCRSGSPVGWTGHDPRGRHPRDSLTQSMTSDHGHTFIEPGSRTDAGAGKSASIVHLRTPSRLKPMRWAIALTETRSRNTPRILRSRMEGCSRRAWLVTGATRPSCSTETVTVVSPELSSHAATGEIHQWFVPQRE